MSFSDNRYGSERIFPDSVQHSFRDAVVRLSGCFLILLALLSWLSLLTWSIHDPSLNHATSDTPDNWAGVFGAAVSDLLFQFLGLSSIAVSVPPAIWGWHLVARTPLIDRRVRVLRWPVGVLCIATGLSFLSVPVTWPLPNGLGGISGDFLLKLLQSKLFDDVSGVKAIALTTGFVFSGIYFLLSASALRLNDFKQLIEFDAHRLGDRIANSIDLFIRVIFFFYSLLKTIIGRRRFQWQREGSLAAMQTPRSYDVGELENELQSIPDPHPYGVSEQETGFNDLNCRIEPHFGMSDDGISIPRVLQSEPPDLPAPVYTIENGPNPDVSPTWWFLRKKKAIAQPPSQPAQVRRPAQFKLPHTRLLTKAAPIRHGAELAAETLRENARFLEDVLNDFGVKGEIVNAYPGPVVTLYELEPARGTKSARVISLADDIARSMSAVSARVAVIPGKNAIGIELPNSEREMVFLRTLIESSAFASNEFKLPLALGKNIGGEPMFADLTRMPHLLIAGTTGSGKSVGINTMILSLLYRLRPDQCKFIMIDPKMLELSVYDGIPHLLSPVVTDPKKAVSALKWTVREMEERYKKMAKLGVRNIDGYNERVVQAHATGEILSRTAQTGFDRRTGQAVYEREEIDAAYMPFIVVVVDEMADLMMVAGKEIEAAVQRLAQMARAAGIHLITATQRPSVDVITGTIKANFPTRISFQVTSKVDSRTILGEQGGEQLLGAGDMLYMAGGGRITRVHGPFVSDEEIERITGFLKSQGVPEYLDEITEEFDDGGASSQLSESSGNDLYDQAVAIVLRDKKVSTSYIQRRLSIGYNRAATIIERMEENGIISPANHAGRREILATSQALAS